MTTDAVRIRGNALALPLADDSVDLIVSSPPYFALRSYQDGGEHYAGQIGAEPTPDDFVDALIAATREMVRVVKPSGSIWVNLGDKYAGSNMGQISNHGIGGSIQGGTKFTGGRRSERRVSPGGVPTKSLIGIPWRYALRCIDELGLILRAEVIWGKPNGLPESVTDRTRRSHEQWFHLTRSPRYYSAVDEIREAHLYPMTAEQMRRAASGSKSSVIHGTARGTARGDRPPSEGGEFTGSNPLGKLPGSVWVIPTEPLNTPTHRVVRNGVTECWFYSQADAWRYMRRTGVRSGRPSLRPEIDHFAAFPTELPRRIIQGWSPAGVCVECGEGRRPVTAVERVAWEGDPMAMRAMTAGAIGGGPRKWKSASREVTGYACACPEPTADTTPGVVLDPFGGTGTTALVAKALGRRGISVDMSQDYCRLARWRTTDPGELAKAQQLKKPAKQVDGQVSVFDLLDEADGGAA